MITIGIIGAAGKMGRALMTVAKPENFKVLAITHSAPLDGVTPSFTLESAPIEQLHLLIDFSHAASVKKNIDIAVYHKKPLIIGTTGHSDSSFALMHTASQTIPLLYSSNFSIGMHLIKAFITHHLPFLSEGFIDIFETHHLEKKDLPSGTSLDLASLFKNKRTLLHSPKERSKEELIIHSARLPSHPGMHTLELTLQEESLTLQHQIKDRKVYAQGALLAAQFLIHKKKGFYTFSDVFATPN